MKNNIELPINKLAYILSTSRVESYDFHNGVYFTSFEESISTTAAENKYGYRTSVGRILGNTQVNDGSTYIGRGFCQVTGRANYQKFTNAIGVDLINNPNLAKEYNIALKVIIDGMLDGVFTGKKLSDYITSEKCDYLGARHIINGTNLDFVFEKYANSFLNILKESM